MISVADTVTTGIKLTYAAGARGVGRVLTRVGVLADVAPDRDRRLRHWAYSLTCAHDSMAIAELDVPWWTYRSIDVLEAWLDARAEPVRVFEWGSGASTIWLARRTHEVHSVEHHRGFGEHLAPRLVEHSNVHFRIVEPVPSPTPAVPSQKEGNAGLDFSDYVSAIDATGGCFDVIVLDGRARGACLRAALPHLARDGIVVFDNSRRRRYRDAIDAAPVVERRLPGLTPTLPYPDQTSVLTHRA